MGRYRKLEQQRLQLGELRGIVASMKTLSQLELHKLGRQAEVQERLVGTLQHVVADFLAFHPQPDAVAGEGLWLVIGSERGFCGDFNARLVNQLLQRFPECQECPQRVVAVGRRLWPRMGEVLPGFIPLPGASVGEELPRILIQVADEIRRQLERQQLSGLQLLYHGGEQGGISTHALLPPETGSHPVPYALPPLLQLPPHHFYAGLLQHYLQLRLGELFTTALRAENHYRVAHLEGAVNRLDERLEALGSHARIVRQEEITEEIETILLGGGGAGTGFA